MNRLVKWSIIVCLLVATTGGVLYFRARMSTETRHMFLPIEVFNLDTDLSFTVPPPKGVSLNVSGPSAIVNRLAAHPPNYPLDLSGAAAGINPITVSPELLNLPPELIDVKLLPQQLYIRLEAAAVKHVPVSVALMGQPASGFMVVDTLVQPAAVSVSGPQSIIAPLDRIATQPVDIGGMTESFRRQIALVIPEGLLLRASSRIADIDIRIAERIESRIFSGIRVVTPETRYPTVVAPPVITLEVRGPVRALDQLKFTDGSADTGSVVIDTSHLKPGIYLLRAVIQLPLNTTLVNAAPDFFTVTLSTAATHKTPKNRSAPK